MRASDAMHCLELLVRPSIEGRLSAAMEEHAEWSTLMAEANLSGETKRAALASKLESALMIGALEHQLEAVDRALDALRRDHE